MAGDGNVRFILMTFAHWTLIPRVSARFVYDVPTVCSVGSCYSVSRSATKLAG